MNDDQPRNSRGQDQLAVRKSTPWSQSTLMILALLTLALGLFATARTELGSALLPAFMGTLLLLSGMIFRLEWQLTALSELLRRSQERISRLEQQASVD